MTDEPTQRTAAATAARRRHGEEQRAEFLRSRGWTVTPPEGTVRLTAIVRPAVGLPDESAKSRVAIVGPPSAGGRPRANLDGLGAREVTSFYVPVPIPKSGDQLAKLRAFQEELSVLGYEVDGPWHAGVDPHGRVASVPVKRVAGR